jgi:hypothetical protein
MQKHFGGCHCGNVTYVLLWPSGEPMKPRTCNCSFCVGHGAIYTSHPQAALDAKVADRNFWGAYKFGTQSADFRVCRRCGTFPFALSAIDGSTYAVLNVRTLADFSAPAHVEQRNFEGEALGTRLTRRRATWIPVVSIAAN